MASLLRLNPSHGLCLIGFCYSQYNFQKYLTSVCQTGQSLCISNNNKILQFIVGLKYRTCLILLQRMGSRFSDPLSQTFVNTAWSDSQFTGLLLSNKRAFDLFFPSALLKRSRPTLAVNSYNRPLLSVKTDNSCRCQMKSINLVEQPYELTEDRVNEVQRCIHK